MVLSGPLMLQEGKKEYVSPARGLNFESFVLEVNCVNGHKGMQQLTTANQMPVARAEIRIIGEESGSSQLLEMYCQFGQDCTKENCRYMHTCSNATRTPRRRRPETKQSDDSSPKSHSEPPKRTKVSSSRRRRLRRKRQKEKWQAIAKAEAEAAAVSQMMWAGYPHGTTFGLPPSSHQIPHPNSRFSRVKSWDTDKNARHMRKRQVNGGSRLRSRSSPRFSISSEKSKDIWRESPGDLPVVQNPLAFGGFRGMRPFGPLPNYLLGH